jgi:hypothetical protein
MEEEELEGWYTDPYERHEARWISKGVATQLVRDGAVEGNDPAPDGPFNVAPTRIEGIAAHDGSDLKRADDAEREAPYDPKAGARAAWDVFDQSTTQGS